MDFTEIVRRFDSYRNYELPRLQLLNDYLDDKHAILGKQNRVKGKEDARVICGYANYIATIATSYFLGKNISYSADANIKVPFQKLSEYLTTEEEQQCNYELAWNCSVFGKAYELVYLNNFGELKHKCLDTRDVFVMKDNTINRNIICAVRFNVNKITESEYEVELEVYDSTKITTYKYTTSSTFEVQDIYRDMKPIGEKLHGFTRVPIIEYSNNKSQKGDFESVISLINAYETSVSTSVDDLTDFSDAILLIRNASGTKDEDIANVKKDKVILMDGDGNAEWLIKSVNDTFSQNVKDRINNDIHKFSFVPDMSDEKFSGNTSGVALEYKLLALEQLGARKEMYFKKSLNSRLDLFIDFLNIDIKATDIQKVFTRNLPRNLLEISQVMQNVSGMISKETCLSLFPPVEDPENEMKKMEKEASDMEHANEHADSTYKNVFGVEEDGRERVLDKEAGAKGETGEQNSR